MSQSIFYLLGFVTLLFALLVVLQNLHRGACILQSKRVLKNLHRLLLITLKRKEDRLKMKRTD